MTTTAATAIETCRHGHPWTPENIYIDPRGRRQCRACRRETSRRWREANPGYQREYLRELRLEVFSVYGTRCRCCASAGRLELHHVNDDGREHRERAGGSGTPVLSDLRRAGSGLWLGPPRALA